MIALASTGGMLAAMRSAGRIELSAYTLRPGRVLDALEGAARRGARVTVRLEGRPYGDAGGALAAANARGVAELRRLGADAKLVDANDGDGAPLHMKAAICDRDLFLDDRNWPDDGTDTIVRDTFSSDVRAVRDALDGRAPRWSPVFSTTKAASLRLETQLLRAAARARTVEVASESFGAGSGVYGQLERLAKEGVRCRLLVADRERRESAREALALERLARAGVEVRTGSFDEKFAIVDSRRAWVGSTNATSPYYDANQRDWGLRTDRSAVVSEIENRFEREWALAADFSAK